MWLCTAASAQSIAPPVDTGVAGATSVATVAARPAPPLNTAASPATTQEANDKGEIVVHPWVVPPKFGAPDAYFTNLSNGARLETPFVLKFGLIRRGPVPAGHSAGRAGRHHLLIDQALPSDLNKPLPFNDHCVHFGKGRLETVIDLPPGEHTVRLLLADKAALVGRPHVELLSPIDKSVVKMPMRVQFQASGFNISHAAAKVADTGHFRPMVDRRGQKPEVIEFDGGRTEAWLDLPKGDYDAQLDLVSNTAADKRMARSEAVSSAVP